MLHLMVGLITQLLTQLLTDLLPAPLHRAGFRLAHGVRKRWLRWRKGEVHGCSIIARDAAGRVLLVRHSYGAPVWAFPGGGMRKGEDPLIAATREFAEELRCALKQPRHLGVLTETYHGATNIAHVFTAQIDGEPRPDQREIVDARFFAITDLPERTSITVHRRLALLVRDNA